MNTNVYSICHIKSIRKTNMFSTTSFFSYIGLSSVILENNSFNVCIILILFYYLVKLFTHLFLISLVPGSSRRTFYKMRPSKKPDVRLSRIWLFIWLIICLISVYPTLFSLKSSSSCQSLCIGQVSFSDIATCGSLSSSGISHLLRCRVREIPSSFSLP